MRRPSSTSRWCSGRSARTPRLVAVVGWGLAVAAALVLFSRPCCFFFVGSSGRAGFGRMTAAGAPPPGEYQVTEARDEAVGYYVRRRRRLLSSSGGGPGSHPPRCTSKCGSCSPCSPVHVVAVSPGGVVAATEYYPEVWRCKCRDVLYMP